MNIEQANTIPLATILQIVGAVKTKETAKKIQYLSPLRAEKTASLDVQPKLNLWYDHGDGKGGDSLSCVQAWLHSRGEDGTVSDVLR